MSGDRRTETRYQVTGRRGRHVGRAGTRRGRTTADCLLLTAYLLTSARHSSLLFPPTTTHGTKAVPRLVAGLGSRGFRAHSRGRCFSLPQPELLGAGCKVRLEPHVSDVAHRSA